MLINEAFYEPITCKVRTDSSSRNVNVTVFCFGLKAIYYSHWSRNQLEGILCWGPASRPCMLLFPWALSSASHNSATLDKTSWWIIREVNLYHVKLVNVKLPSHTQFPELNTVAQRHSSLTSNGDFVPVLGMLWEQASLAFCGPKPVHVTQSLMSILTGGWRWHGSLGFGMNILQMTQDICIHSLLSCAI